MSLVHVDNVTKTYGLNGTAVTALSDARLEIAEREFVALMGPSGSGKSTLLSVLGAMNPPTHGRLLIDALDIYALSVERLADFRREYLGFVFQQLFLVPYLTAVENVMLPLAAARIANGRQRGMAANALARVGLADKQTRLPRELSGGEQQRVAIARAIVNAPPLLLADEPTGCLDSRTGREIIDVFESLRDSGLTIFMVTHDAAIARRSDRILYIADGRLTDAPLESRASA